MSFLYPYVIKIERPDPKKCVGTTGYGGQTTDKMETLFEDVPAGIQRKGATANSAVSLPSDSNKVYWEILFILPKGSVQNRDVVTDELGRRFQVDAAYWTPLNYQCICKQLEA